eukprot:2051558-Rhodomonas_salina.2
MNIIIPHSARERPLAHTSNSQIPIGTAPKTSACLCELTFVATSDSTSAELLAQPMFNASAFSFFPFFFPSVFFSGTVSSVSCSDSSPPLGGALSPSAQRTIAIIDHISQRDTRGQFYASGGVCKGCTLRLVLTLIGGQVHRGQRETVLCIHRGGPRFNARRLFY